MARRVTWANSMVEWGVSALPIELLAEVNRVGIGDADKPYNDPHQGSDMCLIEK